ncbi:hypothetical protein [Phenylobacterium sp. J367]|uniref:hypothetical protein n=1 Tax=Phenylobacterium sp. J367 TaxID=2898435 RepID=UPI0021516A7C|nr:hypothetical protein [Phenylobacterium sp. J367]MCR5879428.1 hypothetical protein [Phenylobacterium sp. J367]
MDNDDAIMAGGDDLARAEELGLEAEELEQDGAEGLEPETLEIELDGQVYEIPAALKGAFLRQADYTRKTQDLAEQRRAVEAERQALAQQSQLSAGASRDRMRLAALDEQLADFDGVDWRAFAEEDRQGAETLWGRYQAMGRAREELARAVAHADERDQLKAAREAADRMAETGRKLAEEIDGWSPETAAKLVEYAQAFGVTLEELAEAADPRLWKLLHKAWRADQAGGQEIAARAQAVRPAVQVTGAAGASGGVRDELALKDWMARRNEQMARGR